MDWKNYLFQINNSINKIPNWVVIFLLSAINFISFDTWPNEENNFTMAKHFLDPDWMAGSFSLQQWPGTNYVYWFITGLGLKIFTFGQFAFVARSINYLLYAFPLGRLFKRLNISIIWMVFLLQLFMLKQTYFGGEWLWQGFGGKTIAYIFILWAINYILDKQYVKVALFAALATYCHVLVGGWFFVSAGLFVLISEGIHLRILKVGLIYLGVTFPFIVFLGIHIFSGDKVAHDPSPDWIYVFYRNVHHTAPTILPKFWMHNWAFVVLLVGSLYFFVKKNYSSVNTRMICKMAATFNLMMVLGMLISFVDTGGLLLKFYVFRIGALAMLMTMIGIVLLVKEFGESKYSTLTPLVHTIILVISLPLIVKGVSRNVDKWKVSTREQDYISFIEYAKGSTAPEDMFLLVNFNDKNENVSFIADAERDRLVSFKMVPEGDQAIGEWYDRIIMRDGYENDPINNSSILSKYGIDYVVSKTPAFLDRQPVFQNEHYHVYQIK